MWYLVGLPSQFDLDATRVGTRCFRDVDENVLALRKLTDNIVIYQNSHAFLSDMNHSGNARRIHVTLSGYLFQKISDGTFRQIDSAIVIM